MAGELVVHRCGFNRRIAKLLSCCGTPLQLETLFNDFHQRKKGPHEAGLEKGCLDLTLEKLSPV